MGGRAAGCAGNPAISLSGQYTILSLRGTVSGSVADPDLDGSAFKKSDPDPGV